MPSCLAGARTTLEESEQYAPYLAVLRGARKEISADSASSRAQFKLIQHIRSPFSYSRAMFIGEQAQTGM